MRTWKLGIAGLVAALLAVSLVLTGCGGSDKATVPTTGGFDVADYAGKPLVVNFFGSWCGPCNAEAPALAEFAAANPDVRFVGIAVSDTESNAQGFMDKYGLDYTLIVDDDSISAAWAISGVPTTIFFTSAGEEVDRIVGAAGRDKFEQSLAKAE